MTISGKYLYSSHDIRQLEKFAIEQFQISEQELMHRAGNSAFACCVNIWPNVKRIIVLSGSGNNGGDGYVLAAAAHARGLAVRVLQLGNTEKLPAAAANALHVCQEAGISISPYQEDIELHADLIVDAMLGIGLSGEVREPYASAIQKINATDVPVFAIDLPSGVDADQGGVLGTAIQADATMTYIGFKKGMLTGAAKQLCGKLFLDDLQVPPQAFANLTAVAKTSELNLLQQRLTPRDLNSHKGDFGRVLVIGGDLGMAGAVTMAGVAALRVGAGRVTIATQPEHVNTVSSYCPPLMVHGVSEAKALATLMENASVIILGPGLGQSDWSRILFQVAISCGKPMVIDADGLNLLASEPMQQSNWVLTPHPGEAARLANCATHQVQQNRLQVARQLQVQYGGVVVLKGAGTIVMQRTGQMTICPYGNPGMASAGMGDVLSGVIGGLLAQFDDLDYVAELGVSVHAYSGDLAANEGARGMCASDLYPFIRQLVNPS